MVTEKVAHASSVKPEDRTRNACATTFFDPKATIAASRRNLPHWYQEGASYFVTFRLADSIPQVKLKEWTETREIWLTLNPEPRTEEQRLEYTERFTDRIHQWLDADMGSCLLGEPKNGRIVAEALRFFSGERYHLGEFVVMPNHVHVIFQAIPPYTPKSILHSWKSYTGNEINRRSGRSGELWQRESYDRLIRSPRELFYYAEYIRDNPVRAQLAVIVL